MIHCNGRVVVIDFHVLETKKYSFYINDELFDVHVERQNGRFAYGLEIDEDTETPRNIRRKKRNREDRIKAFAIASIFVLALATLLIFFH